MDARYMFRGKTIDGVRPHFVIGHYVSVPRPMIVSDKPRIGGGWDADDIDPATIGQCTGLRDKNGKLIFEGDIVKTHYANTPKADHVENVVFHNGKFMAECKIGETGKSWALLADGVPHLMQDKSVYMDSCEIIGNIHDDRAPLNHAEADDGRE